MRHASEAKRTCVRMTQPSLFARRDRVRSQVVLRLPEPMLASPGAIPTGSGWVFEPKLDGFRCLTRTHGGRFRARSRRGWDMTSLLPDLGRALPPDLQL